MTLTHPASTRPEIVTVPVALIYEGDDLDDIEATDAVIISDKLESVDIGGGGALHGVYLRVTGPDLVAAADALHRLADRITETVLDARQAKIEAARVPCAWCRTLIDPEDECCGSSSCVRQLEAELRVAAVI